MPLHDITDFCGIWRSDGALAGEKRANFPKNPWPTLCASTHHDAVGSGQCEHFSCLGTRINIPVRKNGNSDARLDGPNRLVFRLAFVMVCAGSSVNGESGNAGFFGQLGDAGAVAVVPVPPRPHFKGHGNLNGRDNGRKDRGDEGFVPQQGRSRSPIADLFGGAAHIDINDLRAEIAVALGSFNHHLRLPPGNLHNSRIRLARVIHAKA